MTLEEELALYKERCNLQENTFITPAPHEKLEECPTYYDGCNCTVETLEHNIDRAQAAENEVAALRELVARRPALDKPTLYENVAHAIKMAGENEDRAVKAERAVVLLRGAAQKLVNYHNTDAEVNSAVSAARTALIATAKDPQ